ncbi:MAG: 6-hydroxymethylpterin diphosphokinase MptE-like protein [Poseidonibacter sp.]|uniref:6-hydroxymethylpterin diphosphokinase MptE-like protein n=1 Tax=Poseidonibacter sp. TaxID=2321188 RepID=UPI00359D7E3C
MQEIQQTMIEIYQKNISYFKLNHPDIFEKIQLFEKINKETYHIDFIDNHFELIHNNTKTYNCDPFYDAQYRAKNIFNNENIFSLINTSSEILDYGDFDETITSSKYINEYINELKNKKDFEYDINKFIFIGTLLGIHLNDIDKIIQAKAYLIIEPNIEIFRLSLFLTDYEELSLNSKLFFCVNFSDSQLKNSLNKFLSYKSIYNNFIRFELASKNELELISTISEFLTLENKIRYPFSEYIYGLKRGFHYLNYSNNGFINLYSKKEFLKDLPILFLAAGPSLDKYIEFIKKEQDRFIIVCAAAILKHLYSNDIKPDIIISIDAGKSTVKNQFDVEKEFYKDAIIIASIKTDTDIFKMIDNSNVFFIQTTLELVNKFGLLTGVTVGDIGIKILLSLGANNLYLIGLDGAINEDTGETHFSSYYYKKNIQKEEENSYKNHLVSVKGNFKDEVKTTLLYKDMIDSINSIDSKLIENSSIFNLSNGAYFNNTSKLKLIDINIQNFKIIDKNEIKKSFKNHLKTISKKGFSKLEESENKKEQKIIKKLSSIRDIEKDFLSIQNKYNNSFVIQIVNEYFLLTNPYNYYVKDKKIQAKQLKEIIEEFKTIYKS